MKLILSMILVISGFVCVVKSQQIDDSNKREVYIVGDVIKPSKLTFNEAMTLNQVIKQVGGILPGKKHKIVYVYRLIAKTKDREIIKVKLNAIQKKQIDDFVLQPFDIVEVRLRKKKFGDIIIPVSDKPTVLYKIPTL